MVDECSKPPHNRELGVPKKYNWHSLTNKGGADLEGHYTTLLRELGKEKGILVLIFTKSQDKIQDPPQAHRHVNAEQWVLMGVKDKGDIYKGLLEKNTKDT